MSVSAGMWVHNPQDPGLPRQAWSRLCHVPSGGTLAAPLCLGGPPNDNLGEMLYGFVYNNGNVPYIHQYCSSQAINPDVIGDLHIADTTFYAYLGDRCFHHYVVGQTSAVTNNVELQAGPPAPCDPGQICHFEEFGYMSVQAELHGGQNYRDGVQWNVEYVMNGQANLRGTLVDATSDDSYREIAAANHYVLTDAAGNDILLDATGTQIPVTDDVAIQLGTISVVRHAAPELGASGKTWTLDNSTGGPFSVDIKVGTTPRDVVIQTYGL